MLSPYNEGYLQGLKAAEVIVYSYRRQAYADRDRATGEILDKIHQHIESEMGRKISNA